MLESEYTLGRGGVWGFKIIVFYFPNNRFWNLSDFLNSVS